MSRVPVSAPGKAFLIGEYAVLEGARALVTAIDARAIAHDPHEPGAGDPTAVVRCAHARVQAYLEAHGFDQVGEPPTVETGGFTIGPRKLGLGSSAAVATAVVGFHLVEAGLDPTTPEVQSDALGLALAAHAEAQGGGGSGADVAAAVLGGIVGFERGEAHVVTATNWLAIGFVDVGMPAITSSFLRAVGDVKERNPVGYAEAISLLRQAAELFHDGFTSEPSGAKVTDAFAHICEATELHNRGLRLLQAVSGAPIMTPQIELVASLARASGLAVKPSGAGGGDLVVLFCPSRAELERFGERLRREHGISPLSELRLAAEGLRAEQRVPTNSRLAGFFQLSVSERRKAVSQATGVPLERFDALDRGGLDVHRANHMIENVVGTFELPLAIATNFRINGRDVLVPMCVEEASVVAAASNAAKMIRAGGGFIAHSDAPWMIAQIQLLRESSTGDADTTLRRISDQRMELLALADTAHPRLVARGGGARELELRKLASDMLAIHVLVDCQDAMGANLLNTVAETLAPELERITGWTAGLRILSNLSDKRCSHVRARIPPDALACQPWNGDDVITRIVAASRFAELDPYRAATHNKGIMNGVDAVVLATGNDWRAMEAGAHAFACRSGRYGPLAVWTRALDGCLEGRISFPTAVGVVGGATRVHPIASLALELLGCASGTELGQVVAAAGLATNLAALRALATEGIQRGHMSLHARTVAMAAGAQGDEVDLVARQLVEVREIKAERAANILEDIRTRTR